MNAYPVIPALSLNSAAAALLVVLVLLVQWFFRRQLNPQWRCALWLVVFARLVLPVSIASPVSLMQWLPRPATASPAKVGSDAPMIAGETTDSFPRVGAPVPQFSLLPMGDNLPISGPAPASVSGPQTTSGSLPMAAQVPWAAILFATWFAGIAVLGANVLWSSVCLQRQLAASTAISDPATLDLLRSCAGQMGVRWIPPLAECPGLMSPALHGFLRPRLLLPTGFTQDFSVREQRLVFLHELAHLKRHDLPQNWLITGLQILHWFNPLLWLGFSRWRADREVACDALALEAAGADHAQEYARTILHLLERNGPQFSSSGLVGILEDYRQLHRRLEMISTFAPARRRSLLALALVGALAAVGLTDARTQERVAPTVFAGFTHVAFVIDTSGSMRDDRPRLRPDVINTMLAVLDQHTGAARFAVLDYDGNDMVKSKPGFGWWLSNGGPSRKTAVSAINVYKPYSRSNPAPGLEGALHLLDRSADSTMKLFVCVIGDEFIGDADALLRQLDGLNPPDVQRQRRASINAVQIPTAVMATGTLGPTGTAFAQLMTRIAGTHAGTYRLLPSLNQRKPLSTPWDAAQAPPGPKVVLTAAPNASFAAAPAQPETNAPLRESISSALEKNFDTRIGGVNPGAAPATKPVEAPATQDELTQGLRNPFAQPNASGAAAPAAATATRMAFVIDTSGSMRDPSRDYRLHAVVGQLLAVELDAHPEVREFAVISSDGARIWPAFGADWSSIGEDSRQATIRALNDSRVTSEANPAEGIYRALLRDPSNWTSRIRVVVIGDEFAGSTETVLRRLEEQNPADAQGNRRASISAIQLLTGLARDWEMGVDAKGFSNLMSEVARIHGGTYRWEGGLNSLTTRRMAMIEPKSVKVPDLVQILKQIIQGQGAAAQRAQANAAAVTPGNANSFSDQITIADRSPLIVVTGTDNDLRLVRELVGKLDKPQPAEFVPTPAAAPAQPQSGIGPTEPWRVITARELNVVRGRLSQLPPDDGVVAPMAVADDKPEPNIAERLRLIAAVLPLTRPTRAADPLQHVRNLLYLAGTADVNQLPIERHLPGMILEQLTTEFSDRNELAQILYWIAGHPQDGDDTAIDRAAQVIGNGSSLPSSDKREIRGRAVMYAVKLMDRILASEPRRAAP